MGVGPTVWSGSPVQLIRRVAQGWERKDVDVVNGSALVEINQKFHGWGRDHYYRDFWMFARRDGRWWLVRYDYEPQPPFDRQ